MNTWTKSSRSAQGNCVEVRTTPTGVEIRDSHQPHGPVLAVTRDAWRDLLHHIRTETTLITSPGGEGRM